MKMSKSRLAGWVLSGLLAAFLIVGSGVPKFIEWEGKEEMMGKLGWTTQRIFYVGIAEVSIAVLFLIPRTSFIGAILLAAYLGGATATHVRVGDPFVMPVVMGVLGWVALGLRDPRVFALAFGVGTR
ncbi:MAG: DoxX family protein [Phycisphaerales bacterium]